MLIIFFYKEKNLKFENYLIKSKHPNGGLMVVLDDMFDICLKIHKDCGYQERDTMLKSG